MKWTPIVETTDHPTDGVHVCVMINWKCSFSKRSNDLMLYLLQGRLPLLKFIFFFICFENIDDDIKMICL